RDVDALGDELLADEAAHVLVADAGDEAGFEAEPRRACGHVGGRAADIFAEARHVLQPPADLGAVEVDRRAADGDDVEHHTVPPRELSSTASSWPPAIMSCSSSALISPRTAVPSVLPRLSTVKRSPTAMAWRTLCVMKTMPMPALRTRSMVASTFAVWRTPSAEVGSSRMSTLAPK